MHKAYRTEATHALILGNVKVTDEDVRLLAADIEGIANDEFDAGDDTNCESQVYIANQAQVILRQRIGGWANLESYMRCLRVHV
jgi:hypothetical protein